nr:uncharacterized protein LOC109152134 [Ipomoea batatas]
MPYAEFEQYTPEIVHKHFGMQNSELSPASPSVQQNLDQDTCSHAVADELETTSPIVGSPSSQPRRSSRNRRIPNKFQDYYCDTIMKKFHLFVSKLGVRNLHAPTYPGVLEHAARDEGRSEVLDMSRTWLNASS